MEEAGGDSRLASGYEHLSVPQLRSLCAQRGAKQRSNVRKAQLIAILRDQDVRGNDGVVDNENAEGAE